MYTVWVCTKEDFPSITGCSDEAIFLTRASEAMYVFDPPALKKGLSFSFTEYDNVNFKASYMSELHFRLLAFFYADQQHDYIEHKYSHRIEAVQQVWEYLSTSQSNSADQLAADIELVCQKLLASDEIDYGDHADVFNALKKYCDLPDHSLAEGSDVRKLRHNYDLSNKTFISASIDSLQAFLRQGMGIFSPGKANQPHEESRYTPKAAVAS